MEITFKQWRCKLEYLHYSNGRIAIQLNDVVDGSLVAVATINIPDIPLQDNQVIIKDYSENDTMLSTLMSAGIVTPPVGHVQTGYVSCPIVELLKKE